MNAPADYTARMIDCYVEGSLNVHASMPSDYSGNVSVFNNYTGGVAGYVIAEEVSGVKALVSVTTTNDNWNRDNYTAGAFGIVFVSVFENNSLLAGSKLFSTTAFVGGLVCRSSFNGTSIRNCTADYEFKNTFAGNHPENVYIGGLIQSCTGAPLIDRCSATVEYDGNYYGNGHVVYSAYTGDQWIPNCFGGLISVDGAISGQPMTVTNCSAVFTGLPVVTNSGNSGLYTSVSDNSYYFENCYSDVNIIATDGAAAGIFVRSTFADHASADMLTIKNCFVTGTISVLGTALAAGIAIGGPADTQDGSSIENCVSTVTFNVAGGTPRIGGIWASDYRHNFNYDG